MLKVTWWYLTVHVHHRQAAKLKSDDFGRSWMSEHRHQSSTYTFDFLGKCVEVCTVIGAGRRDAAATAAVTNGDDQFFGYAPLPLVSHISRDRCWTSSPVSRHVMCCVSNHSSCQLMCPSRARVPCKKYLTWHSSMHTFHAPTAAVAVATTTAAGSTFERWHDTMMRVRSRGRTSGSSDRKRIKRA